MIHRVYRAPKVPERRTPADLGLPYETVRIPTENGKRLFAWLVPAGAEKAPAVAVIHGWGGNAEHMLPFAALFNRAGYTVLLLVHGEDDERVPSTDALRIYANKPDGHTGLLMIPGAGHDSRKAISTHGEAVLAFLRTSGRRREIERSS
jgi:dienelactone hydrolase